MKKKALQSYKNIPTIKQESDNEKAAATREAEKQLDSFIHQQ